MTQNQYFSGLTLRLRPVDFTVLSQEDVLLLLEWDGRSLCLIASGRQRPLPAGGHGSTPASIIDIIRSLRDSTLFCSF